MSVDVSRRWFLTATALTPIVFSAGFAPDGVKHPHHATGYIDGLAMISQRPAWVYPEAACFDYFIGARVVPAMLAALTLRARFRHWPSKNTQNLATRAG